jgi:AcrR family transcriptional regulator
MRRKTVEEVSRVEQRKRATRDRILKICEELFILENDYDNVTMREIARRAKVSVGALYLHFKTKEDILATLIARFTTKQREDLEASVPPNGNGAQQLDKLLNFFDQLCSNPRFVLYSQLPLLHLRNGHAIANAIRQTIIDDMTSFVDFVTEIFREGKADGSLNFDVDPHLAAVTLVDASLSLMLGITMRRTFGSLLAFPSGEYNVGSIFSVFRTFLSKAMILSHHKSTETG